MLNSFKSCRIDILFVALFLFFNSFKAPKVTYSQDSKIVKTPLSGSEYKSDNNYYRVVTQGRSPILSTAEKIAMSNARSQMASQISTIVSNVARNFEKQISDGTRFDNELSYENMSIDVSKEVIPNMNLKAKEVYRSPNNIYDYWVCTEVSKKEIANRLAQKLKSTNASKIESDRDLFQKILDEEMRKINN